MGKYDDIISLPHPVSKTHPPMPRAERAAQFSSFAALSGYEEAVEESARLTEMRTELDRDALEALDGTVRALRAELDAQPAIEVRFFVPDERKAGGRYETLRGHVRRLNEADRTLILTDGTKIEIDSVVDLTL